MATSKRQESTTIRLPITIAARIDDYRAIRRPLRSRSAIVLKAVTDLLAKESTQ